MGFILKQSKYTKYGPVGISKFEESKINLVYLVFSYLYGIVAGSWLLAALGKRNYHQAATTRSKGFTKWAMSLAASSAFAGYIVINETAKNCNLHSFHLCLYYSVTAAVCKAKFK